MSGKKTNVKIAGLLIMIFYSMGLFSQIAFNIKVVDSNGRPAEGVLVTFDDKHNNICPFGITDNQGKVSFQVKQIPELVYAYDSRKSPYYGATCLLINQSRAEYIISIPFVPRNEIEIGNQINNIYEKVRKFYGYYSTLDFIQKASRGIQTAGSAGLGAPYLFSVHILPTFEDGKAYLEISGKVADFLFAVYFSTMNQFGTITGNDAVFQYGGSVAY